MNSSNPPSSFFPRLFGLFFMQNTQIIVMCIRTYSYGGSEFGNFHLQWGETSKEARSESVLNTTRVSPSPQIFCLEDIGRGKQESELDHPSRLAASANVSTSDLGKSVLLALYYTIQY